MDTNLLLDFDRRHLWHPYTSMIDPLPVYPVVRAEGVYIELATGERLIDGMSSWWCTVHGYNHPLLNEAVREQTDKMSHVMFGGLTHEPAVSLARRLVGLLPEGLDRIFYCDSGSVSVEVAIKMALQFMQSRGKATKTRIATVRGGYHGDTWHAMSVCDPVGGMHSLYCGRLPVQLFAPRPAVKFGQPWEENAAEPLRELIRENADQIAALIIEPVVQGAGGMWIYNPEYLRQARDICREYDVLLIADEIATGFMRTGRMFACQWAGVVPDIMCVGKAITGGYMSFGAAVASGHVAEVISANPPHSFMHGPTFMGNPLACAVSCASLDLLLMPETTVQVKKIGEILEKELAGARQMDHVADVRTLGTIGVIEMKEPVNMAAFQRRCVQEGIWIRPFGKLVYIMPPYVITDGQLTELCRKMVMLVAELD